MPQTSIDPERPDRARTRHTDNPAPSTRAAAVVSSATDEPPPQSIHEIESAISRLQGDLQEMKRRQQEHHNQELWNALSDILPAKRICEILLEYAIQEVSISPFRIMPGTKQRVLINSATGSGTLVTCPDYGLQAQNSERLLRAKSLRCVYLSLCRLSCFDNNHPASIPCPRLASSPRWLSLD